MFDHKTLITIFGMLVAIAALCKFNNVIEPFFMNPGSSVKMIHPKKGRCPTPMNNNTRIKSTPSGCNSHTKMENMAKEMGGFADEVLTVGETGIAIYQENSLPVGDMLHSGEPIIYDRLITSNKNSRTRGLGDHIRGDLPIIPNCNGGWFTTTASFDPKNNLQQGALNVLAGQSQAGDLISDFHLSYSDGAETTVAGVDVTYL